MAISNTEFYIKTLEEQDSRVNKILENHLDSNDEIEFKTLGVSFPPEFLCWLPVVGSLFINFGMKEYIIGITKQKVIISKIQADPLMEEFAVSLPKKDILRIEVNGTTVIIFISNGKNYTFKEMPEDWAISLEIAVNKLLK